MSSKPEPAIWSHDTDHWIAWFDSCQINSNMDAQNQRCGYHNGTGTTLLFIKVLAYGHMVSHVTTKIFYGYGVWGSTSAPEFCYKTWFDHDKNCIVKLISMVFLFFVPQHDINEEKTLRNVQSILFECTHPRPVSIHLC